MPIGLGLASSHAPNMFVPPDKWPIRYAHSAAQVPQPADAAAETLEVRRAYAERIDAAFGVLAQQLAADGAEALIMVSDDQNEVFDRRVCMPTFAVHLGESASGTMGLEFLGPDAPKERINLRGHPALAELLARELVERGVDLTCVRDLRPIGKPAVGLPHGFTRTAPRLMPKLEIPVVMFFVNCYYPPLPSAQRCLDLGRALREILEGWPERVAIYGSGGLSHDPGGPRAGWIDRPLDRFVLEALATGRPERLAGLYTFDSDTVRGGTGEIRNWLVVAGAMGNRKATVVDYIPVHHAVTGLGFAYWPRAA